MFLSLRVSSRTPRSGRRIRQWSNEHRAARPPVLGHHTVLIRINLYSRWFPGRQLRLPWLRRRVTHFVNLSAAAGSVAARALSMPHLDFHGPEVGLQTHSAVLAAVAITTIAARPTHPWHGRITDAVRRLRRSSRTCSAPPARPTPWREGPRTQRAGDAHADRVELATLSRAHPAHPWREGAMKAARR